MRARWLTVLPLASALLAQNAPPEPASVAGTVTNSVTGEPILRAHVFLRCSTQDRQQEPPTYGALTNEKGEFSIKPVPPAQCNLNVERVGFVAPRGFGQPFSLSSGTHKEAVKLALTPTGAITGRIVNAAGEPAQNIQVTAETANAGGSATTDDKGQFRLGGLRPGRYLVRATPQKMPFPPEIRADGSIEMQDAATYYPASLEAKTAQRLEVKAGVEVSGADIKLVATPIVKVSGTVVGVPPGAKDVMVMAQPDGQNAIVKADGTFTMWRLDPGKYRLQATHWAQTPLMSASVEVEIAGANLEHIELRMVPPFDLAGQLRFDDEDARQAPKPPKRPDGSDAPAPPPQRPMVLLNPLEGTFNNPNAPVDADDSFTLRKAQPGKYRVMVMRLAGYVKSLRAGDTEVDGDILDVRNGAPGPLTITLSSNYCEISGTVSDSNGPAGEAGVLLSQVDDPRNTKTARSDASGSYTFRVAPGKYKLAAVDEDDIRWRAQGPDFDDYQTEIIEVSAGDKIAKDLVKQGKQ